MLCTTNYDIQHTLCCAANEIHYKWTKCSLNNVFYLTLNISLFHFSAPFMLEML